MLKRGQLVMLVGTDGYMPPLGATGEVVGFDGEHYEVLFENHPCPNPPGDWWLALPSWLMPLPGKPAANVVAAQAKECQA